MDPVRFTFSRRQESRRLQQVSDLPSEEKGRETIRRRLRIPTDSRYCVTKYTPVLVIMALASRAVSSSLIVPLCRQDESIIVHTYTDNFYKYFPKLLPYITRLYIFCIRAIILIIYHANVFLTLIKMLMSTYCKCQYEECQN